MRRRPVKTRDEATRRLRAAVVCLCAVALLPLGCKKDEDATPTPEVYVQAAHPEHREHQRSDLRRRHSDAAGAGGDLAEDHRAGERSSMCSAARRCMRASCWRRWRTATSAAAVVDNKGAYTAAQATYDTATKAQVPEDLTKAKLDLAQAKATLDLNQSHRECAH